MKASDIALELEYNLIGDDYEVSGINWASVASEKEIAVITEEKEIYRTKARVILTSLIFVETDKTLLICDEEMDVAVVHVCQFLIKKGILKDYSKTKTHFQQKEGYYVGSNSKIGKGTIICPGAVIGQHVTIGERCSIGPNVVIESGTVLGDFVEIGAGSVMGAKSFYHYYEDGEFKSFCGCGAVIVENHTEIGCNTVVQRGVLSNTHIGEKCMIGNGIDIGHDVTIGNRCKIVSQTGIAGNASIKNDVLIFGQVGIANKVEIGNQVIVKGKSRVTKSVRDYQVIAGNYGREYSEELRLEARMRKFFSKRTERKDVL